jgi:dsDNA-specific endonuclease/ATPase MutS2
MHIIILILGARVDVFHEVMADIGDMQSVSGDLSTFSGHLVICREMLDRVKMLAKQSKRMMRLNSQGDDEDDEYMDEMNLYNNHDDNSDVVDDKDDFDESVDTDYNDQGMFSSLVLLDEIGTG